MKIKAPVFNIMGADDVVFPPQIVIDRMRSALARGGNTKFTSVILPATSHGMMKVQTLQGRGFRRAINPDFVRRLTDWIAKQSVR